MSRAPGGAVRVQLRSIVGDVSVVRSDDAVADEEPLDPSLLFFDLDAWLTTPSTCAALLRLCGGGGLRTGDGARETRLRLEDAFRRGRLRVVRLAKRPTVVERPIDERPRRLGPEPERPTFIELSLIDAKGNPVANERYRITLQSREVREGRLDGAGVVRIDDVLGEDFVVGLLDRQPAPGAAHGTQ
jgi:hypothetical protein